MPVVLRVRLCRIDLSLLGPHPSRYWARVTPALNPQLRVNFAEWPYQLPNTKMGLLPLTYRRPAFADKASLQDSRSSLEGNENDTSDTSLRSGRSGNSAGIPPALAFDRIIDGGTCPVSFRRDICLAKWAGVALWRCPTPS